MTEDFEHLPVGPGYTFNTWLRDDVVDRDERRLLSRLIDRGKLIAESDPPDVYQEWQDRGIDASWRGRRARGLLAAFLLDSLAVSLAIEPWEVSEIEIEISRIQGPEVTEARAKVRHISHPGHLESHEASWLTRSEENLAVFRRKVDPWSCVHICASKYSNGKHVRGRTNEDRKQEALNRRDGQFLAEYGSEAVTDSIISTWEFEAVEGGWLGVDRTTLRRDDEGATFYIYVEREHIVGYEGGTGNDINRMRVEWSSGNVHSHPRNIDKS